MKVYQHFNILAPNSVAEFFFQENPKLTEIGLAVETACLVTKTASSFTLVITFKNGKNTVVTVTSTFEKHFDLTMRHPMVNPQYFEKLQKIKFLAELRKILLKKIG